jgi:hypothetical protein
MNTKKNATLQDLVNEMMNQRTPTKVCLCGSTRFSEAFKQANLSETLKGNIVLSIGCDTKSDEELAAAGIVFDEKLKKKLDVLHLHKIWMADVVLILNVDGYIGESTRREIEFATRMGKTIRYLEPLQ